MLQLWSFRVTKLGSFGCYMTIYGYISDVFFPYHAPMVFVLLNLLYHFGGALQSSFMIQVILSSLLCFAFALHLLCICVRFVSDVRRCASMKDCAEVGSDLEFHLETFFIHHLFHSLDARTCFFYQSEPVDEIDEYQELSRIDYLHLVRAYVDLNIRRKQIIPVYQCVYYRLPESFFRKFQLCLVFQAAFYYYGRVQFRKQVFVSIVQVRYQILSEFLCVDYIDLLRVGVKKTGNYRSWMVAFRVFREEEDSCIV